MNCEECRKEFLESEEDSFVSITAVIHRFFCPDCRREIEEFGRAIELLRDDPDAEAPEDLSRIVLARISEQEGEEPLSTVVDQPPGRLGRWLIAGGVLLFSPILAAIAKPYLVARGMHGNLFIIPISIVLGLSFSVYAAFFIGSHMDEISSLIHLKKNG